MFVLGLSMLLVACGNDEADDGLDVENGYETTTQDEGSTAIVPPAAPADRDFIMEALYALEPGQNYTVEFMAEHFDSGAGGIVFEERGSSGASGRLDWGSISLTVIDDVVIAVVLEIRDEVAWFYNPSVSFPDELSDRFFVRGESRANPVLLILGQDVPDMDYQELFEEVSNIVGAPPEFITWSEQRGFAAARFSDGENVLRVGIR